MADNDRVQLNASQIQTLSNAWGFDLGAEIKNSIMGIRTQGGANGIPFGTLGDHNDILSHATRASNIAGQTDQIQASPRLGFNMVGPAMAPSEGSIPAVRSPPTRLTSKVRINGQETDRHIEVDRNDVVGSVPIDGNNPAAGRRPVTLQQFLDGYPDEASRERGLAAAGFVKIDGVQGGSEARYAAPVTKLSGDSVTLVNQVQSDPAAAARYGLRQAGAAQTAAGGGGGGVPGDVMSLLTAGSVGGAAGGALRGFGNVALGGLSTAGMILGAADSMSFYMRKQMRSVASNFGDSQMIAMINSPGITIESLIYYFMAYMSDKYEDKLREKMEEVVLAEQRERRMQQRRDQAEFVGGFLGLIPGVGTLLQGGSKMYAETLNRVDGAMSGSSKSTTVLMQEVQILVQNWKMITDMTSNLSKTLHEMAMTAVRNIR